MSKRILMVLTSHDRLGDTKQKTGFWLEEFAAPYYVLKDAGCEVTLASPAGGKPPLDPKSSEKDAQTDATRRFHEDRESQKALENTHKLSDVNPDDFDAVFYPGGHGPLWDLTNDHFSQRLIERLWSQNKPVAAICHAPTALLHVRDTEGNPLVRGKRLTGFADSEEDAVGLRDVVPHLVEDALKDKGAHYTKAGNFEPHVEVDGRLITGQNPASSEPAARALLEALKAA